MAEQESGRDIKWELLVADTWDDADLKQRLLSDPAAVLAERGIDIPEGVSVNVVEDTADTINLVLPEAPGEEELSEEELESVAGGHVSLCFSVCGGRCGGGCGGCGGRCGGCGGRCGGCGGRCGGCGGRCGGCGGRCGGRCRP